MAALFILIAVMYLFVLDYFIAKWFSEAAWDKGYKSRKYYWICFWLGLIGYLLVIALPDRGSSPDTFGELPEL